MPKARYRSALEVGCSIGVLTRSLASRCDTLIAIDAAQAPLLEARRRCADLPDVRFEHMFVPDQWPDGAFELILLSEVVYYLSRDDVGRLAARVITSLTNGGSVILVHWTGLTNYPLSGDQVTAALHEIEASIAIQNEGFENLVRGSNISRPARRSRSALSQRSSKLEYLGKFAEFGRQAQRLGQLELRIR